MRTLGLVALTHDSGIAVLEDGKPLYVIEEERLNRIKRTMRFPALSLRAALGKDGEGLEGVEAVAVPWDVKKLRRSFVRAVFGGFPRSLTLLNGKSHTPQNTRVVILNSYLRSNLARQFPRRRIPDFVNVGHHDAHAAAFFLSPFEEAIILVMDGYGDDAATSIYTGAGNRITRHWQSEFFNSLGMVYTFVTDYLGFGGFSDEGKVMALAAFGDESLVEKFRDCIHLTDDGRYRVNMDYFSFNLYGELKPLKQKFYDTFGPPRRKGEPMTDRHRAVAFALQKVTEETIVHMVRDLTKRFPSRNLVIAGGVGLNCVANARVLDHTEIKRVWVPPVASDTGVAIGAALWHQHQLRSVPRTMELMHPSYGLNYSDEQIINALNYAGLTYEKLEEAELLKRTASDLARGMIVGWFQGRFEMGPRALGNRSILADPRREEMRDVINAKIKHRESFRPFAPAVLEERASDYFFINQPDPFMTMAPAIRPEKAHDIPAAVHADGTGRIQTVSREANPRYYGVIEAFGQLTGVPVLLNTSFNRQEPIVARPADAISCYLRTGMDALAIGDYYVTDRNPGSVAKANANFTESRRD